MVVFLADLLKVLLMIAIGCWVAIGVRATKAKEQKAFWGTVLSVVVLHAAAWRLFMGSFDCGGVGDCRETGQILFFIFFVIVFIALPIILLFSWTSIKPVKNKKKKIEEEEILE